MSAAHLLSQLRSLGAEVGVSEGRLRVSIARGQLTDELKAAIAAQKGELLALLAEGQPAEAVRSTPLNGSRPLSFFQERLWFLHRLQPENTAYNLICGWLSPGAVDVQEIVKAIEAIGERHEILSTRFRESDGEPEAVLTPARVPVEVRDMRAKSPEQQEAAIEAERQQLVHTPFDLRNEAPARFILYRVAGDRVLTTLLAHHIIVDPWSLALLGDEIMAAYEGKGLPVGPARSYADFVAWQRSALDDRRLIADLDWWQRYLSDWPALSTLPSNRVRARLARGATRKFRFDRTLSDGVRALVREERVTLYMALVSAFASVLGWYSGQTRLLLGSPMGLRERPEFESIVGPFVNVLVLKLDLTGDPSFAELLARTRTAVLDAHAHRDVPFERLVQRMKPQSSADHTPLFQAAVVLHNGPATVGIDSGGALYDLSWFVRELDGEIVGGLEYRSDAYAAEAIDELLARLEAVLRAAMANRQERVSNLPRLFAGEPRPSYAVAAIAAASAALAAKTRELEPPALTLADRPAHGAERSLTRLSVTWSDTRREGLARAVAAAGAAPKTALLAAFVVLSYRYTGRTDFSLLVLCDGSGSSSPQGPVLLPLRVRLAPESSFGELLRSVAEQVATAEAVPLEQSLPELAHDALPLPVMCDARSAASDPASALENDSFERLRSHLELHFRIAADGSAAWVAYDEARFEPFVIARLVGYFGTIIDAVSRDPGSTLSRVPLLVAEERTQLLRTLHATFGEPPPLTPVTELFAEQVRRHPDALAVSDATGTLTYRELDQAALALALRLRQAGVTAGSRVAVGVERSRQMIVALLAVLKVGAAYLPVDPRYPLERLTYLLEDGAPVVLLTDESSGNRMPPVRIPIVKVGSVAAPAQHADLADLGPANPDAIAYVIYTSGSTGRPKGVQIPHRALTNFLLSMQRRPGLTPDDRVISLTTLSFDIAGLEIFLPLVTGASIHVAGSDIVGDGALLAEFIGRSDATLLQATPATYRMLIDAGWQGSPRLKLLCGGEAMPRELADQLLARGGSLWNMYGPTETTIWSTIHQVTPGARPVPIGSPIANTAVYVLDAHGELLPHGVPGELFIGGAGVARGYLKRPELDAQRFTSDAFLGGDARMYRTGDAARLAHDGTFEYLGRLDDQVKIRGHRIELGEIESVLREHPEVAAAVVAVRETTPGDQRLIGYYVPRSGAVSPRDLRELCQRKLPPAMVPSAWVALKAIPLTPNGKTDRKSLPAPENGLFESEVEIVAPRDAIERELVQIWEGVLGTRVPSIRDSFFDLGGHSLLVARALARVEKSLDVSLPLSVMLESPTIEHIAERIRELQDPIPARATSERHFSYVVPIRRQGARLPLFCVHGAGGNVLNLYELALSLPPEQPFYGIQAAGVDGLTRPKQSIEEIADDYLVELKAVQPHGPYYLSGYCGGGIIAYEMAQRLRAEGENVALLILIDAYRPGSFVPRRVEGWKRALVHEDLRALARRAKIKVKRDFGFIQRVLQIQYYLRRGKAIPHELREAWLTLTFLRTVESYALKPYDGALTVIRARETNPEFADENPDLGWSPLAPAGVAAHEVPGDHYTLTREPHVKRLTALLEACLAAAREAAAASSSNMPDAPPVGSP